MIHFKIYLDRYEWAVEVFIVTCKADWSKIIDSVKHLECSQTVLRKMYNLLEDSENSGFTYTNSSRQESIMFVNKSTSMKEFINTYNHEKNHVEMHICEQLNINPYSEQAAYLSGELAEQLFIPAVCSFLK